MRSAGLEHRLVLISSRPAIDDRLKAVPPLGAAVTALTIPLGQSHPGAILSSQSHHHRSEHWIVVEGTTRINLDAEERLTSENHQSISSSALSIE